MKKNICYGDSNTFGFNSKNNSRYNENTRWTCLLQKKSGTEYEVINEGVCDRTGFVKNPRGYLFSGPEYFPELIAKTDKTDILILWIGTNDLQSQYDIKISDIEKGLENLIKTAQSKVKNIIVIPPVLFTQKVLEGTFKLMFNQSSVDKSENTVNIFKNISDKYNCLYFDINKFVHPYDIDGIHYDENSHKIIAEKLADFIEKRCIS